MVAVHSKRSSHLYSAARQALASNQQSVNLGNLWPMQSTKEGRDSDHQSVIPWFKGEYNILRGELVLH